MPILWLPVKPKILNIFKILLGNNDEHNWNIPYPKLTAPIKRFISRASRSILMALLYDWVNKNRMFIVLYMVWFKYLKYQTHLDNGVGKKNEDRCITGHVNGPLSPGKSNFKSKCKLNRDGGLFIETEQLSDGFCWLFETAYWCDWWSLIAVSSLFVFMVGWMIFVLLLKCEWFDYR